MTIALAIVAVAAIAVSSAGAGFLAAKHGEEKRHSGVSVVDMMTTDPSPAIRVTWFTIDGIPGVYGPCDRIRLVSQGEEVWSRLDQPLWLVLNNQLARIEAAIRAASPKT